MSKVPTSFPQTQVKDFPYFRHVWNKVVTALMAASFVPLILIGGGMYYYASSILKQKALESLRTEVINHKGAIDQFLAERTMDLKVLSANLGLASLIRPRALETVFQSLQRELPCFTDISIIDAHGRHLAYVGPFELITKNYKESKWFKAVMESDVYISDVFLGYRNAPHFIIAVKQTGNEGTWIIRATVDAVYFNNIVSEITSRRSGEAYLVDKNGIFQTSPRTAGQLMGQSQFKDLERFEGIKLEERQGQVRMLAWLGKVPWLCVVQVNQDEIFKTLYRVRNIGVFVFVLGAILIVFTVLLTTNQLVSSLEIKRRSIRVLGHQLRHTSKMTSSMQPATGLISEINDILSNIDAVAKWIQELVQKDLSQEENRNKIKRSLNQIKSEVVRGRNTADTFLKSTRPSSPPIIRKININDILDDILEFLDRELRFNKITVTRHYQDQLPPIRSDPSQLRQVFQNLILNAVSAIGREGEIILEIRESKKGVTVTVTDSGPGIPDEHIEKIFDPLFTTRPQATGLGLTICAEIMQRLGGRISAKTDPGKGATFIVDLPFHAKFSGS